MGTGKEGWGAGGSGWGVGGVGGDWDRGTGLGAHPAARSANILHANPETEPNPNCSVRIQRGNTPIKRGEIILSHPTRSSMLSLISQKFCAFMAIFFPMLNYHNGCSFCLGCEVEPEPIRLGISKCF